MRHWRIGSCFLVSIQTSSQGIMTQVATDEASLLQPRMTTGGEELVSLLQHCRATV